MKKPLRKSRPRTSAVFLILLFFPLFLSACTVKTGQPNVGIAETDSMELLQGLSAAEAADLLVPQAPIKVGFVQVGHESDWRIASTKSCLETFREENGYELYFVDADNDPQKQVDAVRNFIRDRMDYIIIDPILPTGWDAVLTEAYHAHIPVLLVDRTITCKERYYTAWFGSDFVLEGEYAGAWLEDYLEQNGRGKETVRIVTINGTEGASAQTGRTQGFAKYLDRHANWHHLAAESGDFTEAGGRQVMKSYLDRLTGIDVVVCQNDNEALGACAALEEAGISYGTDGDVIILSFDATKAGLEAVLDGRIHADFECNPLSAPYAADAIQKLEANKPLDVKKLELPERCFTNEDTPILLQTENGSKWTVPVTKERIKSRAY